MAMMARTMADWRREAAVVLVGPVLPTVHNGAARGGWRQQRRGSGSAGPGVAAGNAVQRTGSRTGSPP